MPKRKEKTTITKRRASIPIGNGRYLEGDLFIPSSVGAVVLFAHGSGSSRFSPRNQYVAELLNVTGFATLLIDLLTAEEADQDEASAEFRFNIELLAQRLVKAVEWLRQDAETRLWDIGCFGASTGSAATLVAAAQLPGQIKALVSRGGRPDLALAALRSVETPALLIVGSSDHVVLELNRQALREMRCPRRLEVIPAAGHLFEEPGALDTVADLAIGWFSQYLTWIDPQARTAV